MHKNMTATTSSCAPNSRDTDIMVACQLRSRTVMANSAWGTVSQFRAIDLRNTPPTHCARTNDETNINMKMAACLLEVACSRTAMVPANHLHTSWHELARDWLQRQSNRKQEEDATKPTLPTFCSWNFRTACSQHIHVTPNWLLRQAAAQDEGRTAPSTACFCHRSAPLSTQAVKTQNSALPMAPPTAENKIWCRRRGPAFAV